MHRIYRLNWTNAHQCFATVFEISKSRGKGSSSPLVQKSFDSVKANASDLNKSIATLFRWKIIQASLGLSVGLFNFYSGNAVADCVTSSGDMTCTGSVGTSSDTFGLELSSSLGTLTNNGTILGHQSGLFNQQGKTTTTFNNIGTLSSNRVALENWGSIGTLNNSGSITIVAPYWNGETLLGIYHSRGTIGLLNNTGTISQADIGIQNSESGVITELRNAGSITANFKAIENNTTITTINNSGSLIGGLTDAGGKGIENNGTIGTLNNNSAGVMQGFWNGLGNNGSVTTINNSGTMIGTFQGIENGTSASIGVITNNVGGILTATNTDHPDWGGAGVWNYGNINAITNSGTIGSISGGTSSLTGIWNYGPSASIGSALDSTSGITNNAGGTISGTENGIRNTDGNTYTGGGSIYRISNAGTISGGNVGINNGGTIDIITNSGSISGSVAGIYNTGTISSITNSGAGSIASITNGGSIAAYSGNLPSNYKILINGSAAGQYGRINFGVVSGTMVLGISSHSTTSSSIVGQTLTGVLQGLGSNLSTYISSGLTSSNGYTYSLTQQGSTGIWDLTITAYCECSSSGDTSSGGGSSSGGTSSGGSSSSGGTSSGGSSSSTSTSSNISPGTSVGLSSLGVTANLTIAGGTLVLSNGDSSRVSIAITSAGGTIQSPTSGSATLSGVFSGPGGLTFTSRAGTVAGGTGSTIVLSGANTYSGGTTVAGGTLVVAGPSPTGTGDVFVASAGTLMGTGTIAGNSIVSGVLKPGNSPGYLSFTQNLTLSAGSTYQQDIAGSTQASRTTPVGATGYYSFVTVGSQLTITSGATLTPRLSNLFAASEAGYGSKTYTPVLGDRFRIITASGGISGKFSTLTQPAELVAGTQFVPFYNMANSNSLDLAVMPTSYQTTISAASGNKNAQSVAGALDRMVVALQNGTSTVAQDQLLYATSDKKAASLSGYTQGLSGEVYPATVAVIAQTTQRVQQAVQNRLGDTMGLSKPVAMTNPAGNTALMGATNTLLNGGVASSAVSTNPNVNPNAEARSFLNNKVWGELAYQNGQRNSDSYSGGWTSNLYQLVFGSDFISANGMKLGGGLALSSTTLKPSYGSATIQQGSVFAYGKMPIEEFVVDAMASIGMSSSDISRSDITALGNGFRNKSILGNDVMASLGVSRPFDMDDIRVTPFARVTWQMVSQSGVNEGDIASALNVNRYTGNGVRGMLGLAAGSKSNNPMTEQYTYRVYVGVGADSSGVLNPSMTASLAGLSTTINTPNTGTTFVQAGLYGTAKFADDVYAYAGLSGEARSNQTLGTVNIGLRLQF